MPALRFWLCLCATAALAAGSVRAAAINVPADHATIQAAIEAASSGDEVVVATGTYNERINFNGKAITVRSTDPGNPAVVAATIINGGNGGPVVRMGSGETTTSVLSGLTITGGSYSGIMCYNGASPTVTYNVITGNRTPDYASGGGMAVYGDGASPIITNNTFSNNSCAMLGKGGGLSCSTTGAPYIASNLFTGNEAETGGAAALVCPAMFTGNTVRDNEATSYGAGVYCDSRTANLVGNTITGNSSYSGAGVACFNKGMVITGNLISGNRATYGSAGGLLLAGSPSIVSGNVISNNSAAAGGGGVFCEYNSPSFINNTITGNTASYGGGLYCHQGTWVTLSNTIIAFNGATGLEIDTAWAPVPSSVTLSYCNVYGHTTNFVNFASDPTSTNGNVSVDPLFANAAGGDYRLRSQHGRWDGMAWVVDGETSPCLDAGDPLSDYASEPQPNGGRVNVGYDGNTAYASKSADRPPSRPVWVTVSPSVPGEEDLTGNCDDSMDPEGQDLTYEYQWAKVNPAGGYLTKWVDNPGQVLSAAKVEFGETWQVRARAFDGTSYSTWKAHKKVTITRMVAVIAPASGATNVPVASAIEIAFKWPVAQLSVNRRLRVYNGTALVAGTARWVKQSQRVRFTPKMPLLPGTTYTVRLAEGVETTSGRVLGWSEEYSFTTEGGTGLAAVTVAAARTAAGAKVTVSLSSAATVRAVITNIAGRIVAELPEQDLPAGVSSLLWNGQSRRGTRVPAGTYLVKVQARGADGTQTSALGPLQLR